MFWFRVASFEGGCEFVVGCVVDCDRCRIGVVVGFEMLWWQFFVVIFVFFCLFGLLLWHFRICSCVGLVSIVICSVVGDGFVVVFEGRSAKSRYCSVSVVICSWCRLWSLGCCG